MLAFGQQGGEAALLGEPLRGERCAVDLDGGGLAIEDRDGAVSGVVAQLDGIGSGGGGFEIAVEVEDAEGRGDIGGLDGDGAGREP